MDVLAEGYGLIEGPRVDPEGNIYFSDITNGGVNVRRPDGTIEVAVPKRRGVGGIALHADGGIVVSGRNICHVHDGQSRILFERPDASFNDIYTDVEGRIYAGTLYGSAFAEGDRTSGELWRINAEGDGTMLYDDVGLSNGIGFSPGGDRLYHSDSHARAVTVSDVAADGTVTGRRVFASFTGGVPDGLAVDEEGSVWVAVYGSGSVVRLSPEGEVRSRLEVPVRDVTSVCLSGGAAIVATVGTLFRTDVGVGGLTPPLARLGLVPSPARITRRRVRAERDQGGRELDVHFANLWEAVADEVPDRTALVHGDRRLTWREYDEAAARLADAFTAFGLGPDSKVALYLYNGIEYAVAQYAAFKIRAVPVNVNYRYLDNELLYLLENSDAEVLVFHSSLGDRVERVFEKAEKLRVIIEVDDGGEHLDAAQRFDEVVAAHPPADRIARAPEDIYMLYTGGTTGMPKGVMYAQGIFPVALLGIGATVYGYTPAASFDDVLGLVRQFADRPPVWLAACPQMHGTGMWGGTMVPHLLGGTVVTLAGRSFDAHELWRAVEDNGVDTVVIVGDAFAKPMLRALEEGHYTVPSLKAIVSSGVMWSTEVKEGLLAHLDVDLFDLIGSTEGSMGGTKSGRGDIGETARFTMTPQVKVITEDGRIVEPGSDEMGMVAAVTASLGYFKDPEKSARTFKVIDGVAYSFPGDWAKVAADGSLILLGRGSNCINTGGEKVFPEEVEEAVKAHPLVEDCLVVGVPDERFGERVVAVASLRLGTEPDGDLSPEIVKVASEHVARYKLPKQLILVDRVRRAPNGKADYPWAREVARTAGEPDS